jgi:hypothetical protein
MVLVADLIVRVLQALQLAGLRVVAMQHGIVPAYLVDQHRDNVQLMSAMVSL